MGAGAAEAKVRLRMHAGALKGRAGQGGCSGAPKGGVQAQAQCGGAGTDGDVPRALGMVATMGYLKRELGRGLQSCMTLHSGTQTTGLHHLGSGIPIILLFTRSP